jgi:hypothetical protein
MSKQLIVRVRGSCPLPLSVICHLALVFFICHLNFDI